jgi:hypothetical protein
MLLVHHILLYELITDMMKRRKNNHKINTNNNQNILLTCEYINDAYARIETIARLRETPNS